MCSFRISHLCRLGSAVKKPGMFQPFLSLFYFLHRSEALSLISWTATHVFGSDIRIGIMIIRPTSLISYLPPAYASVCGLMRWTVETCVAFLARSSF
ncbi:hypothetical protein M426DRAFT_168376 [Hypoxylon sp. CI-4A]|nr:hypothetical protein M426DRAFT_168376 [Hypoxylon sp. CI-4A]